MPRKTVNPEMDLMKIGGSAGAEQPEREPAKMPQVGNIPTGIKAAKKATPGMG